MPVSPAIQRWIVVAIVVVLSGLPFLAIMLLQRSRPGEAGSTLSRNTRGATSLYQLAELGQYSPTRRQRALLEPLPHAVAQIWIVQPATGLEAAEIRNIQDWVAGGGTLVLISKSDPIAPLTTLSSAMNSAPLRGLLHDTSFEHIELDATMIESLTPLASWADVPWDLPTFREDTPQGIPVKASQANHPLTSGLPPMLAVPYALGEDWQLQVLDPPTSIAASDAMHPLLSTDAGPIMGEFSLGSGRMVVLTQTEWLTNVLLPSAPCAEFGSRLLAYRTRPGTTMFLEHVHGHTQQLRGLGDLMGASWGQMLLWTGFVLALAIASAGMRFVAPLPQPGAPRPEPGEYVEALGRLYSRAQAWEAVPYNLLAYFRHQARFVADHTATPATALARRRRSARIAAALERASDKPLTPRALQDLLIAPEMDSTAP